MMKPSRVVLGIAGAVAGGTLASCGSSAADSRACGAGTVLDGNSCVVASPAASPAVDGGVDGASSGPAPFQPDDTLVPPNEDVRTLPWLAACPTLRLRHADGTTSPVPPNVGTITFKPTDTAVATPAEPSDCPSGGIIGVAAGSTAVVVEWTVGDRKLATPTRVVVDAARVTPAFDNTLNTVALGDTIAVSVSWSALDSAGKAVEFPAGSKLVRRFLIAATSDPGVASAALNTTPETKPINFLIGGLAAGSTTLSVRYGQGNAPSKASLPIVVATGGTYADYLELELSDSRLPLFPPPSEWAPLLPGTCFDARGRAGYKTADGTYYLRPVADATWTTQGALTKKAGAGSQFCTDAAAQGDALLSVCSATLGACKSVSFVVAAKGVYQSIAVTSGDAAPIVMTKVSGVRYVCPHVQAVAVLADGTRQAITESPAAGWRAKFTAAQGTATAQRRAVDSSGHVIDDATGHPCMIAPSLFAPRANDGSAPHAAAHATITYANATTTFDFDYVIPSITD